jgi:hypothetical protein
LPSASDNADRRSHVWRCAAFSDRPAPPPATPSPAGHRGTSPAGRRDAQHRQHFDYRLHGARTPDLGRGERVTIRLPQIGRIEAFLVWADESRAGFQFERIIRQDDFTKMIKQLQPNTRLRGKG